MGTNSIEHVVDETKLSPEQIKWLFANGCAVSNGDKITVDWDKAEKAGWKRTNIDKEDIKESRKTFVVKEGKVLEGYNKYFEMSFEDLIRKIDSSSRILTSIKKRIDKAEDDGNDRDGKSAVNNAFDTIEDIRNICSGIEYQINHWSDLFESKKDKECVER